MTTYNFGDIVLIGFPHTSQSEMAKRPALVIYDSADNDLLLARITSQRYTSQSDYRIIDWQDAGLILESYIRLGKLATIEKKYVLRLLGRLQKQEQDKVLSILKDIVCGGY